VFGASAIIDIKNSRSLIQLFLGSRTGLAVESIMILVKFGGREQTHSSLLSCQNKNTEKTAPETHSLLAHTTP
jgi:hypothetical protein